MIAGHAQANGGKVESALTDDEVDELGALLDATNRALQHAA